MKKLTAIILAFIMMLGTISAFASSEVYPYSSEWKISATSDYLGSLKKAFDGDKSTYWHTSYTAVGGEITDKDPLPFYITAEFPEAINLTGWRYMPRTDNGTGTVQEYTIFASADGVKFSKIADGAFTHVDDVKQRTEKEATWDGVKAKAVIIKITKAVGDYGTAAEISFLKGTGEGKVIAGDTDKEAILEEGSSGKTYSYDSSWQVAVSSEYNGSFSKAFDEDAATYWHSDYKTEGGAITENDKPPYLITVIFPEKINLTGWRYTPRTDNGTGTVESYVVYASEDGINFGKVYDGAFRHEDNVKLRTAKKATWDGVNAKAVAIKVTGTVGDYGTAAEIAFIKGEGEGKKVTSEITLSELNEVIENAEAGEVIPESYVEITAESMGEKYPYNESWKVEVPSERGANTKNKMFDGNSSTFWETDYINENGVVTKDEPPYNIEIEFPEEINLTGWRYTPRRDTVGTIRFFNIYTSTDGENYKFITSGEFPYAKDAAGPTRNIAFKGGNARFLRIEVTESYYGYCGAAEMEFYINGTGEMKYSEQETEGTNSLGIGKIKPRGWYARASSQYFGYPVSQSIDGKNNTIWHSNYSVIENKVIMTEKFPFTVEYIFPENLEISGISLLPRQDSGNHGLILGCNIYASDSVEGEYVLLKKGVSFDKNKTEKEIPLAGNLSLRKIKIEIREGNLSCASLAEFSVWEKDPEKVDLTLSDYAEEEKKYATYTVDTSSFIAIYDGENWSGAEPGNIFDGSTGGIWQTDTIEEAPVMLTIDMIRPHTISGMTYLPRQTPDLHGHWKKVSIYTSLDGENWEELFIDKTFDVDLSLKVIPFGKEVTMRYMQIEFWDYHAKRVSCAEITFSQSAKAHEEELIANQASYTLKIGNNEISAVKGGVATTKTLDVAPFIVDGSTMIPLRGLLEEMGATITWNGESDEIILDASPYEIRLQIQNELVYVKDPLYGDIMYTLINPPIIKDSRTFVPIRFISEILGYKVSWDGETQTVLIEK